MNEGNKIHFNHLSRMYQKEKLYFYQTFFFFLTFFFHSHRKMVANLSRTIYLTFLLSSGAQAKEEKEKREEGKKEYFELVAAFVATFTFFVYFACSSLFHSCYV